MKEENEYEEVELFTSSNEYEVNEICAVLTDNKIPFIKKNDGTGSYLNLYMGSSIQEKKVLVSKSDYNKAFELISRFIINETEEECDDTHQISKDKVSAVLTLISKIVISMVLILPVIIIIAMLVVLLFQ